MADPSLRTDFTDSKTPGPNQLPAAEYNLNAQRTDEAYDYAQSSTGNVASLNDFFFDPLAPQFGAVGDGVTNDGPAVQAACAAAKAVRGQVVLRRLFLTNQTIVQDDNFGIIGIGNNVGLKAGPLLPTDAPILHTVKTGATTALVQNHVYGCSIRHIRIDGNARSVQCVGWQIDLATNLDVLKVDIHNVDGPGLLLKNSVRESEFFQVHVRCCGNAARDVAAVSIMQDGPQDSHNNLHFYGLYGVWSYGAALDVGAINDSLGPVRGIIFYSPVLHGMETDSSVNDDLTVIRDWRHFSSPLMRIRDTRGTVFYGGRFHRSGYGQPLILIADSPYTATSENWVAIVDGSYGVPPTISQEFTVSPSSDECLSTAVRLGVGALIRFTTTGTLPAPLATNTDYYAIRVGDNTFQIATSRANAIAGTQIDITDAGSGTHTVIAQAAYVIVEPSNVVDVAVVGGRRTDAAPNRPAVVNKAGNGRVRVDRFFDLLMTAYEPYSVNDYATQTPDAQQVNGKLRVVGTLNTTKHIELAETSNPGAGAADSARLYARDNGSGKTELVVQFASGATQTLATEP